MQTLFTNPDNNIWEFTGPGNTNQLTGDVHYKSVRVSRKTDGINRSFGIGDGVWVATHQAQTGLPWTAFIMDLFQEAPCPDDIETGRAGLNKKRITLRWTYSHEDIEDTVGEERTGSLPSIHGEAYWSDNWTHGYNCVEVIEGRAWFIDNEADFHKMNVEHLPPWYWKGDRIHLMRNVFYHMRTADSIVRRLLKGKAGDLGKAWSVPLPNMLE